MHDVVKQVKEDELIRCLLAKMTLKDCAKELKLHYYTILKLVKAPEFQERLRQASEDAWEIADLELRDTRSQKAQMLEEASAIALAELMDLATSAKNESVRFKAAQDLADRDPEISRTKIVDDGPRKSALNAMNLQLAAQAAFDEDQWRRKKQEKMITDLKPVGGVQ